MQNLSEQMDIIAEYYKGIREYTLNKGLCRENGQRIYTVQE